MNRLGNIITIIALFATAGAAVGLWLPRAADSEQETPARPASIQDAVIATLGAPEAPALTPLPVEDWTQNAGWRYAQSFQSGDWDYIISHTLWMQERLTYVRLQSGSEEAVASAHTDLVSELNSRGLAGNQLREEGVEDQYIFTPTATVRVVSVDEGSDDLEVTAAGRVWLEVQYPERMTALLDEDGLPIRRLVVGVNYTEEGAVLKAGIVGNLEIDWESVRFDWDPEGSIDHATGEMPAMQ